MTPETFESEMHTRLGRHYRLRWSDERKRWCIEHRVGRKIDFPGDSDRAIRLRDGYHLVLETLPTNLWVCPDCHFPTPLEPSEKQEVVCDYCRLRGSNRRHVAAYFPLVDKTLTWLEQWHPRRGTEIDKEMHAYNDRLRKERLRALGNRAEDAALDGWRRLASGTAFEALGYCHPSRRDENPILMALGGTPVLPSRGHHLAGGSLRRPKKRVALAG